MSQGRAEFLIELGTDDAVRAAQVEAEAFFEQFLREADAALAAEHPGDDDLAREICDEEGLGYDGDDVGAPWTRDQLPVRYPSLWATFRGA